MWMWKKEKKELENTIDGLKTQVKNLREELIDSRVLQGVYRPYSPFLNEDRDPISLIDIKKEIEGIKEFLNIGFVEELSMPAKSYMKKLPVVGASKRP